MELRQKVEGNYKKSVSKFKTDYWGSTSDLLKKGSADLENKFDEKINNFEKQISIYKKILDLQYPGWKITTQSNRDLAKQQIKEHFYKNIREFKNDVKNAKTEFFKSLALSVTLNFEDKLQDFQTRKGIE